MLMVGQLTFVDIRSFSCYSCKYQEEETQTVRGSVHSLCLSTFGIAAGWVAGLRSRVLVPFLPLFGVVLGVVIFLLHAS